MENGDRPATKADLLALEQRLGQKLEQKLELFEQKFGAKLTNATNQLREELIEAMRDTETRLLKAFYDFAESNQRRLTDSEREAAGLKERMGIIERRVTDIEKRLNMPPGA
jgi:hypothetical protein